MNRNVCLFFATLLTSVSIQAATTQPAPDIMAVSDNSYGGSLERISDNGLWAVGYGKSQVVDGAYTFPRLYDVTSKKMTYLFTEEEAGSIAVMTANDVTNDGSIVVGSYNDLPAIWRSSTRKWEEVENKHQYKAGTIERITPDGKLAIGTVRLGDGMFATMRVWDLSGETPKDITPANLPKPIGPNLSSTTGTLDNMVQQLYAGDISTDGAYFSGMVNFSYPDDCWTFIYDMNNKTWCGVGMEVIENGNQYTFNRNVEGVLYANPGNFVGDTHQMCGELYSVTDESGIFYYDCDNKTYTVVPESTGYTSGMADPLGTIYASKSYEGPMRDWYFKTGKYWYDFGVVAQQLWNIDWEQQYAHDGLGLTGTFTNVSNDGLTLLASDYSASPYMSYLIKLPVPLPEIVKDFNMLGNYYATPVNNSSFANLREVKVTFDRNIDVLGQYNAVSLLDQSGNVVANSISLAKDAGNPRTVTAIFRNRRLEEGKSYTVVFPAGIVSLEGDSECKNDEIRVSYKGRPDAPVAPVTISPVSGSEVSRINANSNPVSIRFNSDVAVVEDSKNPMMLYLLDSEGKRDPIAVLSGSITGDVLSIYPLLEQRLAFGSNYEIVIPAGTVSDISGADPNEEILIKYVGSYLPEGPGLDGVLFEDDFDEGLTNKWMVYDGEPEQEPIDLVAGWGFTAGMPWLQVMENETAIGQSVASHSMFKNPGKADAWLVTPILNISDESTYLSFKSQSYRNVGDHLAVYVYATDDIYTTLTTSIVNNFRLYGEKIYDEEQTPGESEELLTGDWRDNILSLSKYAGKNIYVAFVNENRNKSAVFLDDVKIAMDMKFAVLNLTPTTAVAKSEMEVAGQLQVLSETESYKGYTIELADADGNVVSTLTDADVVASKGWKLDFKMPRMLPLTVGKENKYKLNVTMGDVTQSVSGAVSNLAIETSKKVVIEEYTGQGCQFCPLGHAALEWIQKDFPGLVLPIELHSYPGDNFNNEKVQALTSNLGMSAAPTARINRGQNIISPMSTDASNNYVYKNADVWYDHVVAELEVMAPADIEVKSVAYDGTYCIADIQVTYALDMENANINMLVELCEDDLRGVQSNGVAHDQAVLGEWGANGIYNRNNNLYYYHNVLRNWEGNTFNGTGGLLPSSIKAGVPYTVQMKVLAPQSIADIDKTHVTAMLIDSESGKILNANRCYTGKDSAVDAINSDFYSMTAANGYVSVSYPGDLEVEIYTLDGMKIATAAGVDTVSLDVDNNHGIAIVIVRTADGVRHHKILL